jgi:Domain of unknown function (DUF4384)
MTSCLSDLCLDEMLVGALTTDAAATATDHIATCRGCRTRVREVEADCARFRAAMPPLRMPRRIASRRIASRAVAIAAVASLAATVALVVVTRGSGDGVRTKGGPRLGVVVVHHGAMRVGEPGERLHPGDLLSFVVTSAEPRHVAVLSRDGAGRVSVYFPATTAHAPRIAAGREVQLPEAIALDGTLGRELVRAVFCDRPIAVAALRETIDGAPPAGCSIDELEIEKVP